MPYADKEFSKQHYKQHYEENKEYVLKRQKEHYQKNKERINETNKNYNKLHLAEQKAYRDANRDKRRENMNKRRRNIEIVDRISKDKLIKIFNYKCAHCGCAIINDKSTHIDHLIPVSRYTNIGKKCPHSYNNCVPSCISCNLQKSGSTPLEFYWQRNSVIITSF